MLPPGLRDRLPAPAVRGRPAPPAQGDAGASSDRDPPADRPDGPPPFVVPNDVWNRPRRPARPANPFQALNPFRPDPSRPRARPDLRPDSRSGSRSDPRPDPRRSPRPDPRPDLGDNAPRASPGPSGRDGRRDPGRLPPGLPSLGTVARGLWRLARGHADGLDRFNATVAGFLVSLLPLLLLALLMAAGGAPDAPRGLAVAVVGLLAPPVLSHALAARWGREREWLRYAVAVNWCQWALPMLVAVLLLVVQAATGDGGQVLLAMRLALLAVIAYWLWLNWFIARHALNLARGRAALLVFLVSLGSGALVLIPQRLAEVLAGG